VKVKLAKEICAQFYDRATAETAEVEFNKIFVSRELPDEIEEFSVPDSEKTDSSIWIIKLLVLAGLAKSNGEARRLIEGGGVYIDSVKVEDSAHEIKFPFEGIIKVGKRRFIKIKG
jgi:tyrosyl-tRNA synthetase